MTFLGQVLTTCLIMPIFSMPPTLCFFFPSVLSLVWYHYHVNLIPQTIIICTDYLVHQQIFT